MELWDLLDENRKPLGKVHNRENPMILGEYHVVVTVWTINSNNEILLTLRDPHKQEYPNYWENTAGSLITGEMSRQGAVRELFEETGINAVDRELVFLGTYKEPNVFADSYMVRKDIVISDLTLQEGETVSAKWVTLQQLDDLIEDGSIALPVAKRLEPVRGKFEEFLLKK